jgi:hypothetical protein
MRGWSRIRSPQVSAYARLAGAALVGVVLGTATSFAQAWLNGNWQALANSASPWLLGAFVAGAIQTQRVRAIWAGLGACFLEVAAYYIVTAVRGYAVSHSEILFWSVCAVLGGPLFGCGWAWRRANVQLRPVGAAFLPATFIAEAIGTYAIRLNYHQDAAMFGLIGLVILAAMLATLTRLRSRIMLATAGLAVVDIGVYWLGLNVMAGAAFGA